MIFPPISFHKSRLDRSLTILSWFLLFCICVFVAFFKESIFPKYYFSDTYTIERYAKLAHWNIGDSAYANTAKFYRYTGLMDRFFVLPLLGVVFYFYLMIQIFRKLKLTSLHWLHFMLILFFSVIAMVYMTTFSKDFIVFLMVAYPLFFIQNIKRSIYLIPLFCCIYAFFFRPYWFMIGGSFVLFSIAINFKIPLKYILILILIGYIILTILFKIKMGIGLNDIRNSVNENRVGNEDSKTAIMSILSSKDIISQALNTFLTCIFLIIPLPLIMMGAPFYIFVSVFIISLYVSIYKKRKRLLGLNIYTFEYNNPLAFLFALLFVQSIFEPDYGSYIRHLSPFFLYFISYVLMPIRVIHEK